jgi:hypothetical protein
MELRRWKPFLIAFALIDATIEAIADVSREAFRHGRDQLVEVLCAAVNDRAAEEACKLLDSALAESLLMLRDAMPASTAKGALASEEIVTALMTHHASARVRGLALRWRAVVEPKFASRARQKNGAKYLEPGIHLIGSSYPFPVFLLQLRWISAGRCSVELLENVFFIIPHIFNLGRDFEELLEMLLGANTLAC